MGWFFCFVLFWVIQDLPCLAASTASWWWKRFHKSLGSFRREIDKAWFLKIHHCCWCHLPYAAPLTPTGFQPLCASMCVFRFVPVFAYTHSAHIQRWLARANLHVAPPPHILELFPSQAPHFSLSLHTLFLPYQSFPTLKASLVNCLFQNHY